MQPKLRTTPLDQCFSNFFFIISPRRVFRQSSSKYSSCHFNITERLHPVYIPYAYLGFIHRRKMFCSPRSILHAVESDTTRPENACFRLCLQTWFCPSIPVPVSITNPSKGRLQILGTMGQAGERRQEGDQINAPPTLAS